MKLIPLALVVALMSGCALGTRDESKQTQAHRDENTETTRVTHKVGTQAGQPVDITETETVSTKKTRDDASESKGHTEVSSPALEAAAASISKLASAMANQASGGLVSSLVNSIGLNGDAAAGLATVGASLAGWQLHKRGKKKGHAEATKPKALPAL